MSATYEGMSPGGHETYATSIFSKIKTYLDSNPYGYLTTHQDISGKADKSATVSTVTWSNNKLTKTINGTTSDVVSAATILGNLTSSQVTTALGFTPTANTGTITSVKTTAGTHTTINVLSGAANFNVPTKTSHLTNDSGFVTTDANVTQTATDSSSNAEYEVLFSGTADNTTRTEGTRKTSRFTFNPQTNEVAAGHFAAKSDSPSGNKTANLLGYDIQLGGTSNTWDGTNTSLKQSLTAMASDTGWQTVTSSYGDIKVRKIGKVVELVIWSDKAIPANQQMAKLAAAYKPIMSVYPHRLYMRNEITTTADIILYIDNDGIIANTGHANTKGQWVVIHAMWTTYPLPS